MGEKCCLQTEEDYCAVAEYHCVNVIWFSRKIIGSEPNSLPHIHLINDSIQNVECEIFLSTQEIERRLEAKLKINQEAK